MNITAQMVKELRDKTGAGMMDAKKALVETDGDMEKAMDVLRQKGMASADKKMGRIAAEGLIASAIVDNAGAMLKLLLNLILLTLKLSLLQLAQNAVKLLKKL